MRISAGLLVFAICLNASAAYAACEMPSLVRSIPDGATATEEELLEAQTQVQSFVRAIDAYIACENEEMAVEDEETTADYLYRMTRRIEAARTEVDEIAADFNDQVNAFRAAREAAAGIR